MDWLFTCSSSYSVSNKAERVRSWQQQQQHTGTDSEMSWDVSSGCVFLFEFRFHGWHGQKLKGKFTSKMLYWSFFNSPGKCRVGWSFLSPKTLWELQWFRATLLGCEAPEMVCGHKQTSPNIHHRGGENIMNNFQWIFLFGWAALLTDRHISRVIDMSTRAHLLCDCCSRRRVTWW